MEYVYSPIYPVVRRSLLPTSHRSGWALYWAEGRGAKLLTSEDDLKLEAQLRPGDRVLLYHGMEFQAFLDGRPLNVYHGHEESLAVRFQLLHRLARRLKHRLVSLDRPMPAYGALIADRAAYASFAPYRRAWAEVDLPGLDRALAQSSALEQLEDPRMPLIELVIGDSHALSQMAPRTRVARHDALTLHGALRLGIGTLVAEAAFPALRSLTLYFGNVDVRHHLARPGATPIKELLKSYENQLKQMKLRWPYHLTLVEPLPIEDPERKIPKTGWYKGQPYCGSWAHRTQLRLELSEGLRRLARRLGAEFRRQPVYFQTKDGMLSADVMEKPNSVHIRPAHYRHRLLGHLWSCF